MINMFSSFIQTSNLKGKDEVILKGISIEKLAYNYRK